MSIAAAKYLLSKAKNKKKMLNKLTLSPKVRVRAINRNGVTIYIHINKLYKFTKLTVKQQKRRSEWIKARNIK